MVKLPELVGAIVFKGATATELRYGAELVGRDEVREEFAGELLAPVREVLTSSSQSKSS